jgi:hypothetical protein
MKYKFLIFFSGILILILFNCCHSFHQNSLTGQKIYSFESNVVKIYGHPVTWDVQETELNFINKEEVILTLTAVYGRTEKYFPNTIQESKKYDYSFENGILTIPQLGIPPIKLTESENFYTTHDGSTFFKKSITNLSESDKLDRLKKTITTYTKDFKKEYLDKEVVFHH